MSRTQNIVIAVCIFILILVFIFTMFEDILVRGLFTILLLAALLRVAYGIVVPPEPETQDEEGTPVKGSARTRGKGRTGEGAKGKKGDKAEKVKEKERGKRMSAAVKVIDERRKGGPSSK